MALLTVFLLFESPKQFMTPNRFAKEFIFAIR